MEINLKNIELSVVNPRYTTIPSLESNLLEIIKHGNANYDESDVISTLLSREGNFSHLLQLLKSITVMSFDDTIEPILVVKNQDEKIIVAEGNRRIMALKLLNKLVDIPELHKISLSDSLDEEILVDDDLDEMAERAKNYKGIVDLIKNYTHSDNIINVELIESDEVLWKLIYTKHIVGQRPGLRKWPRGKYFVDILSFFPNGINIQKDPNIEKTLLKRVQRSIEAVKIDYKHAQFVRDIFWSGYNYDTTKLLDVYNEMKTNKVSALQANFSIKRILEVCVKELYMDSKEFEKHINIKYDDNLLIYYDNANKVKKIDLHTFIKKWYISGAITTRPISSKHKTNFSKDVLHLMNGLVLSQTVTEETVANIFSYSSTEIEKIIDETKDDDKKQFFKIAHTVVKNNEEIEKAPVFIPSPSDDKPYTVFSILEKQLKHNVNVATPFLNAIGATMRSILEQVYVWGVYDADEPGQMLEQICTGTNKKVEYATSLGNGTKLISKIFYLIRQKCRSLPGGKTMLKNIIMNITIFDEDKALEISNFLIDNDQDDKTSKINSILNVSIHASHKIYSLKTLKDFLNMFDKYQKLIIEILKNIDLEKIKLISIEFKKYIS